MLWSGTITFLVTLIITEPIFAIQCYNCELVAEVNCGEEFNMEEHFKIDCDQVGPPRYLIKDLEYVNATGCMKKIYKEHKILKYVRTCYFGDVNDTAIGCRMDPTMMDFQDVQCLVCDSENFCNNTLSCNNMQKYLIGYLIIFTIALNKFILS